MSILTYKHQVLVINARGQLAGTMRIGDYGWVFDPRENMVNFDEAELREIADKLKELNGR